MLDKFLNKGPLGKVLVTGRPPGDSNLCAQRKCPQNCLGQSLLWKSPGIAVFNGNEVNNVFIFHLIGSCYTIFTVLKECFLAPVGILPRETVFLNLIV